MAEVPIFQVDVFTSDGFLGNPAAVCPLPEFLDDYLLQAVARQNNVAETAFIVPSKFDNADFDIKWFTPYEQINFCSHSTLAAAYVVLTWLEPEWQSVTFASQNVRYLVSRRGGMYSLTLGAHKASEVKTIPADLQTAMQCKIERLFISHRAYHLVLAHQDNVFNLQPDFEKLKSIDVNGIHVTAPADNSDDLVDYVCRCFYPALGILEDPVTLTSYRSTALYWSERLSKKGLVAHQVSNRGGQLWLSLDGDEVTIAGEVSMISQGSLYITGLT